MAYCIGLTGSIGSGKSAAAEIFARLGAEVINADQIARELSSQEGLAYAKIVAHFGKDILNCDKTIDRKQLREIIFSDSKARVWLEHVLHPLIRQQIAQQVIVSSHPYCVIEIPLLINKEVYPYLDKILVITIPMELQVHRVMARDNVTKEHALAIIAAQPTLDERLKHADDVIVNDTSIDSLQQQIEMLHRGYLQQAAAKYSSPQIK